MGIYIKGMEMPKDCDRCRIRDIIECELWKPMDMNEIHPYCPLTEVSEQHGDLVDHSEIGEILIKALDECEISEADKGHVLRMVWIAPTVIESEVEE